MQPPIQPRQVTQQEINEYIQAVLQNKVKDLGELEQEAVRQLQQVANETARKKLRLDSLMEETKQLTADLGSLVGQRQAYVTMLFTAKVKRDLPKPPPVDGEAAAAVESLEALRKKMGAKKIEMIRKDGEVVGEATAPDDEGEAPAPMDNTTPDNPAGDPEPANRDLEPGEKKMHGDKEASDDAADGKQG